MALDRNFWTGLFVIGAAVTMAGAFALSAANQFQPNATRYVVSAENLAGCTEGTSVEMGGYALGLVERVEVRPTPRLHFELTIALRPDVPVPIGTTGIIASRSMAGGVLLRLVPPDNQTGVLPPGGAIHATPETTLTDLYLLAKRSLDDMNIITGEMRDVLVDGRSPEKDKGLAATVQRLDVSLMAMNTTMASVDRLAGNVDRAAARAGPALDRDLAQLQATLVTADKAAAGLNRVLAEEGELVALVADLAHTLEELRGAAKAIQAYDPDQETEMGRIVTQLDHSSASLDRFMAAFEKKPLKTLTKGVEGEPEKGKGR